MRTLTVAVLVAVLLSTASLARGDTIDGAIASLLDESGEDAVLVARGAPWGTGLAPQQRQFAGYRGTGWLWELTPWFYAVGLDGDITADGVEESITTGVGDVFGSTAPNIGIGFGLEIWERDAGFIFATEWMSQGDESGGTEVKIDQASMDIGVGFRFGQVVERRAGKSRWNTGEFHILGRWVFLKQSIEPETGVSQSARNNWWELVLGAAGDFKLSKKWELAVKWDIGGFGIGTSATIDTNLLGTIGYVVTNNVVLKLGYRVGYLDYVSGSGANELATRLFRHGLLLAVTFRF